MDKKINKSNIISLRLTDDEMESVKNIMCLTGKRASDLMREAFNLMSERMDGGRHPEAAAGN